MLIFGKVYKPYDYKCNKMIYLDFTNVSHKTIGKIKLLHYSVQNTI